MIDSDSANSTDLTSEPSSDSLPAAPSGPSSSALVSDGELNAEGRREVASWINEGIGLSQVQKRLADEHGLTLTYMETRFLIDDLDLNLQDPEEPVVEIPEESDSGQPVDPVDQGEVSEESLASEASAVSVEIDKIMRPGAVASGSVTFSDGVATQWQVDQLGRLAVTPKEGYQPSEEDLIAFQQQLQVELRKAGF